MTDKQPNNGTIATAPQGMAMPSMEAAIQELLDEAAIKDVNPATIDVARETVEEIGRYLTKPDLMLKKADELGLPVEKFKTTQLNLQAELARLEKTLAGLEKEKDAISEQVDKGVKKSLFATGMALLAGGGFGFFKKVKGQQNTTLKNAGTLALWSLLPGAIVGAITSLFTYSPAKTRETLQDEKLDAPRQDKEKIARKLDVNEQDFFDDFRAALLKDNLKRYAHEQHREAQAIKSDATPPHNEKAAGADSHSGSPLSTGSDAATAAASPVQKILDKMPPALSGAGHEAAAREKKQAQGVSSLQHMG